MYQSILLKFVFSIGRVVFEAEASGGGEVRQVVSPTLPFPLSLPSPFHSPKFSDKPVGGMVRSSEGEVPRLPPTNTTLHTRAMYTTVCDVTGSKSSLEYVYERSTLVGVRRYRTT